MTPIAPATGWIGPIRSTAPPPPSSRATMGVVVQLRPGRPDPGAPVADPAIAAIERAAAGDHAAFSIFYDEIAPVVYGTVLRVLKNAAMAEEVTQDVFVELWRQAPRFDTTKGSPRSWAATIAHRRAVDRVRSEESARRREETDARQAAATLDDVADEVATNLDRVRVAEALDRLTPPQREAVDLAYYGGHTYREVATILDVPEGTVKTRIRDGLTRLRSQLGSMP